MEWQQDEFTISDRREQLDTEFIYTFLTHSSYWAKGIQKDVVIRSINNSLCFGVFHGNQQIGFGRVISDRATFAYLADVFISEPYRGKGLGTWLISCIIEHPDLQGLRRWLLATLDAHPLYRQHGFTALYAPERLMERLRNTTE
jgi:GNAT superfamily N-acetyltransferase